MAGIKDGVLTLGLDRKLSSGSIHMGAVYRNLVRDGIDDFTTGVRVTKWLYQCKVKTAFVARASRNMPITGCPDRDEDELHREISMTISILDMARINADGGTIRLKDPKQSVEIYYSLVQHLYGWLDVIEQSGLNLKIPEEELVMLDEFATTVFKSARVYLGNLEQGSVRSSIFGGGLLSEDLEVVGRTATVVKDHDPMTEMIQGKIADRLTNWR